MGKIKRQKHVKKTMLFYKQNFGLEAPYTVLIDGTFCKEALNFKINILEQLPKYLDAEVTLATTACVKAECQTFGATPDLPLYAPLKIISQYGIEACPHSNKDPICPSHCLLTMARKRKYLIATQEKALSEKVRGVKGVPLLYIAYQAIHLEAPSPKSIKFAEQKVTAKTKVSDFQKNAIDELKKKTFGEVQEKVKKRRKRKKGPNPLSCLKKKKKPVNTTTTTNNNNNNNNNNNESETSTKKKKKKKMSDNILKDQSINKTQKN